MEYVKFWFSIFCQNLRRHGTHRTHRKEQLL